MKTAIGLGALVTLMLKADVSEIEKHLGTTLADAMTIVQIWAWIITPALLAIAGLLSWLRRQVGDPEVWKELHEHITEYRKNVFSDAGNAYQHHRRVTLYQYGRGSVWFRRWPWNGWLTPTVRSGHTTQSCHRVFRVPPKGLAEGVAGRAWMSDEAVHIEHLPDVQAKACSREDKAAYAEVTHMTVKGVEADPPQARSFYAIRIEVKGKEWGVVVVDNRAPELNEKRARRYYKEFSPGLIRILQRV